MNKTSFYHRGRIALFYLITFIFIISLLGCKGTETTPLTTDKENNTSEFFPVTITDDLGRQITLKTEPKRIVSLAPSNTEILFSLGLGDRVVGVTTVCDYPEEAKCCPKVGGFSNPSLEKIVVMKPDLVLATSRHQQLIKGIEDAGLNVLVLKPKKIEDVFKIIEIVGKATGVENKAVILTKGLKDRVNAVSEKVDGIPENERPIVYYEMWYEPLMTVGRDTLSGQVIKLAGGKNIANDSTEQYPQISEEVIIEKNPEVMFNSYGHGENNNVPNPNEIGNRKGWKEISFVKNNKIYEMDANLLTRPSPRIVDGIEKMAGYLYPELFN